MFLLSNYDLDSDHKRKSYFQKSLRLKNKPDQDDWESSPVKAYLHGMYLLYRYLFIVGYLYDT